MAVRKVVTRAVLTVEKTAAWSESMRVVLKAARTVVRTVDCLAVKLVDY